MQRERREGRKRGECGDAADLCRQLVALQIQLFQRGETGSIARSEAGQRLNLVGAQKRALQGRESPEAPDRGKLVAGKVQDLDAVSLDSGTVSGQSRDLVLLQTERAQRSGGLQTVDLLQFVLCMSSRL